MSRHHRVKLSGRRWRAVKRQAHERDGWRCRAPVCGKAGALEAHHIIAIEDGGEPYDLGQRSLSHCRGCHIDHHRRQCQQIDAATELWQQLIAERMGDVA